MRSTTLGWKQSTKSFVETHGRDCSTPDAQEEGGERKGLNIAYIFPEHATVTYFLQLQSQTDQSTTVWSYQGFNILISSIPSGYSDFSKPYQIFETWYLCGIFYILTQTSLNSVFLVLVLWFDHTFLWRTILIKILNILLCMYQICFLSWVLWIVTFIITF